MQAWGRRGTLRLHGWICGGEDGLFQMRGGGLDGDVIAFETEHGDIEKELAVATAQALNVRDVLAVETFLPRSGELLINDVAPRPHITGHFTIEACITCQFEQHTRAVMRLP